jgi:hypothetical protein
MRSSKDTAKKDEVSASASVAGLRLPASCQSVLAQLAAVGTPSRSVEDWFASFTTTSLQESNDETAAPCLFDQVVASGASEDEVFDLRPGSPVPGTVKFCSTQPNDEALPQGSAVLVGAVGESEDVLFGTGEWNHFTEARDGDSRTVQRSTSSTLRCGSEEVLTLSQISLAQCSAGHLSLFKMSRFFNSRY